MRNPAERSSSLELLSDLPLPTAQRGERIEDILVEAIAPNQKQVRTTFNEEKIQELAESIKEEGLLQPLIIRRADKSLMIRLSNPQIQYELIAGERRLRALKILGRKSAPCIVRIAPDSKMRVLALIENVQREDLGILEKAKSMLDLRAELGTIEKVADTIHKSRSYGFMLVRIGELPADMQDLITKWKLTTLEANDLAGLVKDAEKSGSDKIQYAIRNALLTQTLNATVLLDLKQRYFGVAAKKSSKKVAPSKMFWKTKRMVGLNLKLPVGNLNSPHTKQTLAKEAKKFFEEIGAKSFEVHF